MVLGCYRYGSFPDEDHTKGGGGAEDAERGRICRDHIGIRFHNSLLATSKASLASGTKISGGLERLILIPSAI